MQQLINFLTERLIKSLPGLPSQLKMAPAPKEDGQPRKMTPTEQAHQSSVLVLLFPNEQQEPELVLTLRSGDIDHGGQISFPGGRAEQGESPQETALREAHEEIGVSPESVTTIGQLSELYVSHSENRVTPVVGYMDRRPTFSLNPAEVAEVFAVELESLAHKDNLVVEDWDLGRHIYEVPYWDVHRVPLWGATAMMLSEFLDLYREFKSTSMMND